MSDSQNQEKNKNNIKVPVKSKLNLFTLLAHITSLVVNNSSVQVKIYLKNVLTW